MNVRMFRVCSRARVPVSLSSGHQRVVDEGEISITDSQTDSRRGYYFSIRSTDYITRLLFLTSLHLSYKNSQINKFIFDVTVEDIELRIQHFLIAKFVYSEIFKKQCHIHDLIKNNAHMIINNQYNMISRIAIK